ncbi:MAG: hypothetical protein HC784_15450 [Hydrococcus sp. CSU_1_8]|nr:hypothetical protein [Hydrococcus sp. CSU_1_8]
MTVGFYPRVITTTNQAYSLLRYATRSDRSLLIEPCRTWTWDGMSLRLIWMERKILTLFLSTPVAT